MRVATILLLVALAAVAVSAGTILPRHALRQQAGASKPLPHPEEVADEATRANWARITRELEARNYSRPTTVQLKELGYKVDQQLGAPMDGAYGVDVSSFVGESAWSCMLSKGYNFGVVRNYQEICAVDPNGVHSVANAWAAGMAHMDIYLFPSYGCGAGAAAQVDAAIDSMGSIPFGTLWFDIETGGQGSYASNQAWLQAGIQRAVARIGGNRVGIYASAYEWSLVMGDYAGVYSFPLWYANYDGVPGFSSFRSFGGWTAPSMHQFAGSSSLCSASVDLNWYP